MELFKKGFEVVDLTHTISPDMPCFPGTEPPVFADSCTLEPHGFRAKNLVLHSHTGTHMDAPAHVLEGGANLDHFEGDRLVGTGIVLDMSGLEETEIQVEDLEPFQAQMEGRDFFLIYTGKSRFWGTDSYFEDCPVLSLEAARRLAGFNPKGVGVDVMSVDAMTSDSFPVHRILMERDIIIIENLARLDRLVGRDFLFCCLPLKIAEGDGAPVRAVALTPT